MPVKNHSNESLEKIAEDFLKKYGQGKYDGHALLIEVLIESFGYYIFPVPGLAEIAEAYVPVKRGYIFVDEEQYQNAVISFRWRFTIAEELAHILLHRPLFEGKSAKQIVQIQEGFSDEDYRIIEKNAKFLASCILMPKEDFKTRFIHFTTIQSQRTSNSLQILKYVVRQLNMDFNVSCYSVSLRALHLNLIDQQQMDDLNF
jgi:Zn-dependent peptidase ImmA (M78 family)